ncbi:MAG: amino acid permease [Pirellulaceae bacterium]
MKNQTKLKKELGLYNVYALATGTTLSAGFFLLPGIAVKEAGPAVILCYMLAAIPMVPAMFSMIELATAMPKAGGAYYFLDRSLGPLLGTIGGFGTWLALVLKTSFALIGMGAYVHLLTAEQHLFELEIDDKWLAVIFAIAFCALNMGGAKGAAKFQIILVNGLLAILVVFLTGVTKVDTANLSGFFDAGASSLLATAGMVYISYVGVTNVASVAEEVKDPERNLPLGVILALSTAVAIYGIGTFVMVGVLGAEEMSDIHSEAYKTPVAAAARAIWGEIGVIAVSLAAIFAFSSVVNAGILSASRYPLAMSRDHLLPKTFSSLSKKGLPIAGILITVSLIIALVLSLNVKEIAKLASAFQLLMFALLCLAVVIMRESHIPSYDPGYKSPLYPWMQITGMATSLLLIANMGLMPLLFSAGLIFAGAAWYRWYARKHVVRYGAIFHVFERLGRKRYEGLDAELRGIMKEKGLRDEDPFDDIVARAQVIDVQPGQNFDEVARMAAKLLDDRVPATPEHLLDGFLRDNRIGATPVADGAALPHLRLPRLEHPELVIARAKAGMPIHVSDSFGDETIPDQDVFAIFFLISPEDNPGQHLRILAQIAGRIDDETFMPEWLAAENDQQLKETVLREERFFSLELLPHGKSAELIGRRLATLDWPDRCLIALVRREDNTFVPTANSTLQAADRITIIGDPKAISELYQRYH